MPLFLRPPSSSVSGCTIVRRNLAAWQENDAETYKFLHRLDVVHNPKRRHDSAVDNFGVYAVEQVGLCFGVLIRQSLPLLICGSNFGGLHLRY